MIAPPFPAAIYRHRHAFTPRQERENRAHVAHCRRLPWRLAPRDRQFVEAVGRLHGNIDIPSADRLAVLVEHLFWAERDGAIA